MIKSLFTYFVLACLITPFAGAAPPEPPDIPDLEFDTISSIDELEKASNELDNTSKKQTGETAKLTNKGKRLYRKYTKETDRLRNEYMQVQSNYKDFLDEHGILEKKFIEIRIDGDGIRAVDESGEEFLFDGSSRSFRDDSGDENFDDIRKQLKGIGKGNAAKVEFGDVYIDFDEEFDGDIVAIQGDITVDGFVNGDLFSTGTISLGPDAVVTGKAIGKRIEKEPGAELDGGFEQVDLLRMFPDFEGMIGVGLPGIFTWFVTTGYMIVISLILLLLFKKPVRRIQLQLENGFLKNFFVGLLIILSIGPFFILLCITIIGVPIAILIYPFVLVAGFMLAFAGTALYAGHFAGRMTDSLKSESIYLTTIIGITFIMTLLLISGFFSTLGVGSLSGVAFGFGIAVMSIFFTAGIGAVWFSRFGRRPKETVGAVAPPESDGGNLQTETGETAISPDAT